MHAVLDPIRLEGEVVDRHTQRGIAGARIHICDGPEHDRLPLSVVWTDNEGSFLAELNPNYLGEVCGRADVTLYAVVGDSGGSATDAGAEWPPHARTRRARLSVDPSTLDAAGAFRVFGTVIDESARPLPGVVVRAAHRYLDAEGLWEDDLGWTVADSQGNYELRYHLGVESGGATHPNLRVRVYESAHEGESALAETECRIGATLQTQADLCVPARHAEALSDYEALLEQLSELRLPPVDEESLLGIDLFIDDLAVEDAEHAARLQSIVDAETAATETALPGALYYALAVEGVVPDAHGLTRWTRPELVARVEHALATRRVPAEAFPHGVGAAVDALVHLCKEWHTAPTGNPDEPSLLEVLGASELPMDVLKGFIDVYVGRDESEPEFWSSLSARGFSQSDVDSIRLTLELYELVGGHLPFAQSLARAHRAGRFNAVAELTSLDRAELAESVAPSSAEHSAFEGDLERLEAALDEREPELALRRELLRDAEVSEPVKTLLRATRGEDLRELSLERSFSERGSAFEQLSEEATDEAVSDFEAIQRIARVTLDYPVVKNLLGEGLDSAWAIARLPRQHFCEAMAPRIGLERAHATHAAAEGRALAAQLSFVQMRQAIETLPFAIDGDLEQQRADTAVALKQVANARVLFGAQALCACKHCRSVLSPAAYFVDLLDLLDFGSSAKKKRRQHGSARVTRASAAQPGRNALEVLLARRPDLDRVTLSCENTLTPLPYIDIVNEVLEGFIANENLAHDTGNAHADELRAVPQYVNARAYERLATASYPMTLPFHRPLAVVRLYLGQLDVRRQDLLNAFLPEGPLSRSTRMAEALQTSPEEVPLIASPSREPWKSYGFEAPGDAQNSWLHFLASVPVLLELLGVPYEDLVDALRTRFLNPTGSVTLSQAGTGCDLDTMQVRGATPEFYDRLARFLRLRHRLGWPIADVDRGLEAFAAVDIDGAAVEKLIVAKELAARLDQPVQDVLTIWANLPTRGEASLYAKLFLTKTVEWTTGDARAFQLSPLGNELAHPAETLDHAASAIQAAVRITGEELQRIVADLERHGHKVEFNLRALSSIYAYAVLARGLGVSITEVTLLLGLVNAELRDAKTPQRALEFVSFVELLKGTTFDVRKLNYLLKHQEAPPHLVGPVDARVEATLRSIRQGLLEVASETALPETTTEKELRQHLGRAIDKSLLPEALAVLDPDSPLDASARRSFIARHFADFIAAPDDATQFLTSRPDTFTREKLLERNYAYLLERLLPWARDRRQRGAVTELIGDALGVSHAVSRELLERYLPSERSPEERALADFRVLAGGGLVATTYDNPGLSGSPVATATVPIPAPPSNAATTGFGVRFEGYLLAAGSSPHTFFLESDGRVRLVLASGARELVRLESAPEVSTAEAARVKRHASEAVTLSAWTLYKLTIEYSSAAAPGHLSFKWSPKPSLNELVPTHHLFPKGGLESFAPVRRTFERLHKAAMLISEFDLGPRELSYFVEHAPGLDLAQLPLDRSPRPDAKLLRHWTFLASYVKLRNGLPKGEQTLIDAFETEDPKLAVPLLSKVTGWSESTLSSLLSERGFGLEPNQLRPPTGDEEWQLLRVARAAGLVKRVGVTADKLFEWARQTPDADQAKAVVQAVKSRYARKEWLEVAQKLNDKLRAAQREALVTFLLPRMRDRGVFSRTQLSEYFLMDVEMAPCLLASRIGFGISTVQLFVQRALLNLETDVTPAVVDADEWKWLKNYRVWEANRKVFLYPENWVEPDLRDDQSPLFEQLTQSLLKAELTKPVVERAYLAYLEQLDDIARLDVRGLWHEFDAGAVAGYRERDATDVYHVFGRSYAQPFRYYYRRFVDNTFWTPWTPIEVDILGDHVVPAIVGGRLMLFWLVFEEKSRPPTNFDVPKDGKAKISEPMMDWEIRLESTEYRDGKWMTKALSRGALRFPQWLGMVRPTPRPEQQFTANLRSVSPGGDVIIDVLMQSQGQQHGTQVSRVGAFVKEGCRGEVFALLEAIAQQVVPIVQLPGAPPLPAPILNRGAVSQLRHPEGARIDATGFSGSTRPSVTTQTIVNRRRQGNRTVTTPTTRRVVGPTPTLTLTNAANGGRPQRLLGRLEGDKQRPNREYRVQFSLSADSVTGTRPTPFVFRDASNSYFVRVKTRSQRRTRVIFFRGDQHRTGRWRVRFRSRGLVKKQGPSELFEARPKKPKGQDKNRKRRVSVKPPEPQLVPRQVQVTEIEAKYQFTTFQHSFACEFIRTLKMGGIERLLDLHTQSLSAEPVVNGQRANYFQLTYQPGADVWQPYPRNDVDFEYGGAYANYNWELFFHIPLLVASRLAKEHKHEEAQKWFHYVFDPTTSDTAPVPARFWRFLPFRLNGELTRAIDLMELLAYSGNDPGQQARQTAVVDQLEQWAKKPFNPHAIARLRMVAYQKTTVMRYIDNLIEWGDQLFRKDTIESINEATQLYLLAANILGRREKPAEPIVEHQALSFRQIRENLEIFSNFVVQLETNQVKAPFSVRTQPASNDGTRALLGLGSLYFCIPGNDKLDGYWDLVADRLFKVRNCMNIEGVVRQLPLFQPPIDPALLVRATAAGVDLSAAIDGLTVPVPTRRFRILIESARRAANGLCALSDKLLRAQERQTDRQLHHLELADQIALMQRTLDERKQGIAEARAEREALQEGLAHVEQQITFFTALVDSPQLENEFQAAEQRAREEAIRNTAIAQGSQLVGKVLRAIPNFKVGVVAIGPESTVTTGGEALAEIALAAAEGALAVAAASQHSAEMAAVNAQRHQVKAELRAKVAQLAETKQQFEKQIVAATIREAIAAGRYDLVQADLNRLKEKDEWLRKQFTNVELYAWLSSEASSLLFRSYKLAFDLAKSAERAYEFESGTRSAGILQNAHLDGARKGLFSGERLLLDLDRLESAWLGTSTRELQLTKRVSLRRDQPEAFVRLLATGSCGVELTEGAFDDDYPGHYFRRLRSASVTLKTTHRDDVDVHCTLTLLKNRTRVDPVARGQYTEQGTDSDPRFSFTLTPVDQVVTSHALDDAGQFQLDFKSDTYLPFEGAGAISSWRVHLPQRNNDIDIAAIDDLLLSLRYTARDGGEPLALLANQARDKAWKGQGEALTWSVDIAKDFPAEWGKLGQATSGQSVSLELDLGDERFSPRYRGRRIAVESVDVYLHTNVGDDVFIPLSLKPPKGAMTPISQWNQVGGASGWRRGRLQASAKPGPWNLMLGPFQGAPGLRRMFLLFTFKA
jgi:hypothetical protein